MSLSQSWLPPFDHPRSNPSSSVSRSSLAAQPVTPVSNSNLSLDSSYLNTLHTRAISLQRDLQSLLDAQSNHLNSTARDIDAPTTSTASVASTNSTIHNGRVIPVCQPQYVPLSLSQVRSSFSTTMIELSTLRAEEARIHSSTLAALTATKGDINIWKSRRQALSGEVAQIEQTPQVTRLQILRKEGLSLDTEIQALELQLSEKRSQQRALRAEVGTLENSVASTLSSYQASKRLLDDEITTFLATEIQSLRLHDNQRNKKDRKARWMTRSWSQETHKDTSEEGLEDALTAALEEVDLGITKARQEQDVAEAEHMALEEGTQIWSDVINEIRKFERALAKWMKQQSSKPKSDMTDESPTSASQDLIHRWNNTIEEIQGHLGYIEGRGWNLLVCCIGAELAALGLGRDAFAAIMDEGNDDAGMVDNVRTTPVEDDAPNIMFTASIEKRHARSKSTQPNNEQYVHDNAHPKLGLAHRRGSVQVEENGRRGSATQLSPVRTYVAKRPVRLESEDEDDDRDEDEDDDDAPDDDMLISGE